MKLRAKLRQNPLTSHMHNDIVKRADIIMQKESRLHFIVGFFIFYKKGITRPIGQFSIKYLGTVPPSAIGQEVKISTSLRNDLYKILQDLKLDSIKLTLTGSIDKEK